jgi:hypothetical protein
LPEDIIARAYALLTLSESRLETAASIAETTVIENQEAVQLSFFKELTHDTQSRKRTNQHQSKTDAVIEQIKAADLVHMTPMQALHLLFELKGRV